MDSVPGSCGMPNPVIAVLNHKEYSYLNILNLASLVMALLALVDDQPVPVYYFEKTAF